MLKVYVYLVCFFILSGCVTANKNIETDAISGEPAIQENVVTEDIVEPAAVVKTMEPIRELRPEAASVISAKEPMTYSEVTNLISEFIDIQQVQGNFKEPKYSGTSENNLVTLELIGDKNNLSKASIRLTYAEGIASIDADLNRAMMLRFLRNAVPEIEDWPGRVNNIVQRFNSLPVNTKQQEKIAAGSKVIDIIYDRKKSAITVTIQ